MTRATPPQPAWMASAIAVLRHEWRQFIYSPLTYVFQAAFLVALAAGIFLVADFFATDEASLRLMLTFLPWVALILVPALAMRAWIDEPGDRSLELTLTLPVPVSAVVAGKFLAGFGVLLLTLVFTAPFPLTVAYLGDPDPGVIIAGYMSAAGLLAAFYALSLFAAALLREQVSAFVLGVMVLLVVLLLGWDVTARAGRDTLPAGALETLATLSPKYWMDRMAKGHIEFAAIVYFIAGPVLALTMTAILIRFRRRHTGWLAALGLRAGTIIAFAGCLVIVVMAARAVPAAVDMTAEKEFTLHASVLKIVEQLPDDVTLDLYWSESEPSVPVTIKSYAGRVLDRLKVIASRSQGRITVNLVDPRPDSEQELTALGSGIRRIAMTSGDYFYLGLTATSGGRAGRNVYLDPRRQQLLDYDIALLLSGLGQKKTRKLGILSPLVTPKNLDTGRPGLQVLEELKRSYDVAVIPHFDAALPDGLDVLLVLDATILKKKMLYAIDQLVMGGGGLVVLMDPQLRSNKASNAINPDPSPEINDISDLLQSYGVKYLGKTVVGDAALAASVMDAQQRQSSYPFWLRIPQAQVSAAHPVTADLNELLFAEAGALELTAGSQAIPLVMTTAQSGERQRKGFDALTPAQLASEFKPDKHPRIVAAAVATTLRSAFWAGGEFPILVKHRNASVGTPAIFVVSDIDWIFDSFALQQSGTNGQASLRPLNDNLTLLLNMLEYAGGDPALISIRSRGKLHRPFSHVASLFKTAQSTFRDKETELAGRIAQVEAELVEIPKAAGSTDFASLPDELKAKIAEVQKGLLPLRRELRATRLSMREAVDRLSRRITILNLAAGPVLVLLFAGLAVIQRKRWQRQ